MTKKFLWQLSYRELMDAARVFVEAANLKAGSVLGSYDIYDALVREWQKAKRGKCDLKRCVYCGGLYPTPRLACPSCGSPLSGVLRLVTGRPLRRKEAEVNE